MSTSDESAPNETEPQSQEATSRGSRGAAAALVVSVFSKLSAIRSAAATPRGKAISWAAVALLFVGGVVAAFRALPPTTRLAHPQLLAIAGLVGVPATLLVNGARSRVAAELLGSRPTIGACVRISIVSSAANLLPIPGAFLVRVQWLKEIGAGYGAATLTSAMLAGAWIGVSSALAGILQLGDGTVWLGALLLGSGSLALMASWFVLRAQTSRRGAASASLKLLIIESLAAATAAGRLYLAIVAMGVAITPAQALALTLGAVVASAAGVFPGGLGLREAVCAGLGPLVGLPASVSFIGAAIDRVVGLVVMLPITLYFLARSRRTP